MQSAPASDVGHSQAPEARQVVLQQINLLADDLRPVRALLDTHQLLAAWVSEIVLLGVIAGYLAFNVHALKNAEAGLSSQLESLKQATAVIQSSFNGQVDPNLVNEVTELRQRVQGQEQLAAQLSDGHRIQRTGFSGYLEDLAQNHVDGLWFTHMRFETGGQQILLKGRTMKALYVPQLLKKLASNSHFIGHEFDRFELRADTTGDHRAIDFSITGPAPGPENEPAYGATQ